MATSAIENLLVIPSGSGDDDEYSMMLEWTNTGIYELIENERDSGAGWTGEGRIDGNLEYWQKTSVTINTTYYFRVRAKTVGDTWSDWSGIVSAKCTSDTLTESLTATSSDTDSWSSGDQNDVLEEALTVSLALTEGGAWTEDLTESVTVTAFILDTKSLKTNWGYYLTDSNGKIFEYSESYKNDDDTRIEGYWQGKQADFSDQDNECLDASKIVYTARLYYKDLDADTIISVSISTDGGVTWTSQTQTLGDGDGKIKHADFSFRLNGLNFTPKVSNSSTDKRFQFINLELYYEVLGRYFSKT